MRWGKVPDDIEINFGCPLDFMGLIKTSICYTIFSFFGG
jgi:hypothetical protein